jgi:hypothetical protein
MFTSEVNMFQGVVRRPFFGLPWECDVGDFDFYENLLTNPVACLPDSRTLCLILYRPETLFQLATDG